MQAQEEGGDADAGSGATELQRGEGEEKLTLALSLNKDAAKPKDSDKSALKPSVFKSSPLTSSSSAKPAVSRKDDRCASQPFVSLRAKFTKAAPAVHNAMMLCFLLGCVLVTFRLPLAVFFSPRALTEIGPVTDSSLPCSNKRKSNLDLIMEMEAQKKAKTRKDYWLKPHIIVKVSRLSCPCLPPPSKSSVRVSGHFLPERDRPKPLWHGRFPQLQSRLPAC